MRGVLLLAIAAVAAGCAGRAEVAPPSHPARCSHVSGGYRACTRFGLAAESSGLYREFGDRWLKLRIGTASRHGWWRRVVSSPDREVLLAQWSGECELQSTYLVWSRGGSPRAVFPGAESEIVGWSDDGPARVRLLSPTRSRDGRSRLPGVYRVDPVLLRVYLERPGTARRGC